MMQPEAAYMNAGKAYEQARHPSRMTAQSEIIRAMLDTEKPDDRAEARRLIELGRKEARK